MKIALFDRKNPYLSLEPILAAPEYRDLFDYRLYSSYPNIIEQYEASGDAWDGILFSSAVGYKYFRKHTRQVPVPVLHLLTNFEVYYMALLSHLASSPIPLNQVYIDTQNDYDFIKPLRAILPPDKMPHIFFDYDDFRDDIQEHMFDKIKKLWDDGQVKMAYVSMPITYQLLCEAGIPCKRIEFNYREIINGLEAIRRQATLNLESSNNTVVFMIDFLVKKNHEFTMDEAEYRRATMYKALVDFKKAYLQGFGVTIHQELSRLELSFSRKELDLFDRTRFPLTEFITQHYGMDFVMGAGIGDNITECTLRAEHALEFARDFGSRSCFAIKQRMVSGPINCPECLEFTLDAYEQNGEKAKLADTTVLNFTRCEALIARYERDITAAQIARCLNITERSANRIITKLVENGLLEHQDTKNYNTGKGRPTKRYKKSESGAHKQSKTATGPSC